VPENSLNGKLPLKGYNKNSVAYGEVLAACVAMPIDKLLHRGLGLGKVVTTGENYYLSKTLNEKL